MKKQALSDTDNVVKTRQHTKRWHKVVICLAAIVVFCTTYALILPAITMEQTTYCSIEAHQHSAGCYEKQLVCGYDTEAATGHTHTEACYQEQEVLTCTQEESPGHIHDEDCIQTEKILICVNEEDGHEHTEDCYQSTDTYICGMTEGEGGHTHGPECYETQKILVCDESEEVHIHTDACYEDVLICDKEEHEHSLACYSDPEADVETQNVWERTFSDVKMTGAWTDDVVAIAKSQLGYQESVKNYAVTEDGKVKGYTRYGAWYGDPYGDWCAMFASFCLHYAEVEDMPLAANCGNWIDTLSKEKYDLYREAKDHDPVPGELIFFDFNNNGDSDHVGIVAEVIPATAEEPAYVKTIEGNASNKVRYVTYALDDPDIMGYGMLPEQDSLEDPDAAEASPELPDAEENPSEPETQSPDTSAEEAPQPDLSALTEDAAVVCELEASSSAVISSREQDPDQPKTVAPHESLDFSFRVKTSSYTDTAFGTGRVRLEFVLPLSAEQATFDLTAMPWLDDSEGYEPTISVQSRTIGEEEVSCQVLTGYRLLTQQETGDSVIPGEFTANVTVSVLDMAAGESVAVQISAAMEHNTWDDVCPVHQIAERLTVITDAFRVVAVYSEEEQQAAYAEFLEEIEALEALGEWDEAAAAAAEELLQRLQASFQQGLLQEEAYTELYERLQARLTGASGDCNSIAEAAEGTNWIRLRDSGWFEEYSSSVFTSWSTRQSLFASAAPAAMALADDGEISASPSSDVQVENRGGANTSADGSVSVSKTISGTDLENVFDITLQVQTSMNISEITSEPDMAVVIVMDISNTMNSNFGGVTRYAAAMTAAEGFLNQFAANNSLGISKVGYVAFNTDAHQIFGLQSCATQEQANALKNTMRTQTGSIINADGYKDAHSRFTNVEAGLAMASDMLNGVSNQNKFIIFLSDGFPTTYISSGYSGYDPYDSTGRFHDRVLNKPCLYGTSYSDEAAIRARKKAAAIKASGTTIFSIGVDVAGQTIQKYITQSENANGFSVVDRTGTTYEIGDASSTEAYKNWLRSSIGSGYYYDSTDSAGLSNAYNQIFTEIKYQVEQGAQADWVAEDPIPSENGVAETVEFIGFYDKESALVSTNLTGTHTSQGENTAAFHSETLAIHWDLKQSGYQESSSDGTTTYTYTLVYRVRLKNENSGFTEGNIYPTNDTTTLQYRTISKTDGNSTVSEPQKVKFQIPSVHGYLSDLTFTKVDSRGNLLAGAEFTLSHDTVNCSICRGDGKSSVEIDNMTATSSANGTVTFSNIPSGHKFTLTETQVPDGYSDNGNTYSVEVAYDEITVTVTTMDGSPVDWNKTIVNQAYYELPSTGGPGTHLYTISGIALMALALLYIICQRRRRREVVK